MKKELFEISIKIFKNGEVEVGEAKQASAWDYVSPFPETEKKRGRPRKLKRKTDKSNASFNRILNHIKKRKYTKKSDYWTK